MEYEQGKDSSVWFHFYSFHPVNCLQAVLGYQILGLKCQCPGLLHVEHTGGLLFSLLVSIVTRPMRRSYFVSMDSKGYIIQYIARQEPAPCITSSPTDALIFRLRDVPPAHISPITHTFYLYSNQ